MWHGREGCKEDDGHLKEPERDGVLGLRAVEREICHAGVRRRPFEIS